MLTPPTRHSVAVAGVYHAATASTLPAVSSASHTAVVVASCTGGEVEVLLALPAPDVHVAVGAWAGSSVLLACAGVCCNTRFLVWVGGSRGDDNTYVASLLDDDGPRAQPFAGITEQAGRVKVCVRCRPPFREEVNPAHGQDVRDQLVVAIPPHTANPQLVQLFLDEKVRYPHTHNTGAERCYSLPPSRCCC